MASRKQHESGIVESVRGWHIVVTFIVALAGGLSMAVAGVRGIATQDEVDEVAREARVGREKLGQRITEMDREGTRDLQHLKANLDGGGGRFTRHNGDALEHEIDEVREDLREVKADIERVEAKSHVHQR